jgi:hypothetical protein
MNDGAYKVEVSLSGGTGRALVTSPAELTVEDGEMTARIEWSSPYYDLMIVDGERFLPVNADGNSVFEIPVPSLDVPLDVEAETVAMSEPHLIEYQLTFDPGSLTPAGSSPLPWFAGAALLVLCAAAAAVLLTRAKRKGGKRG